MEEVDAREPEPDGAAGQMGFLELEHESRRAEHEAGHERR